MYTKDDWKEFGTMLAWMLLALVTFGAFLALAALIVSLGKKIKVWLIDKWSKRTSTNQRQKDLEDIELQSQASTLGIYG